MNDQVEENQNHQMNERPGFTVKRTPKHTFTFSASQPEQSEVPQPKLKEKIKRKLPKLDDSVENEQKKPVPPKIEKAKKKKTKSKNPRPGTDTPKFGDKPIDLAAGIADAIVEKDDILASDEILLSLPKNEKYNEDIMIGLNVISYLQNRHVAFGNKVFYIALIGIFVASCVANFWDIITYATTSCSVNFSGVGIYFNFVMLIIAKIGVFNYVTSEMNANLTYDLKFPFIIPILSIGVIANLQLPLILYDYRHCTLRSSLLQLSFGYFVINILALLVVVGFLVMILILIFTQKIRISDEVIKMAKTIAYFAGISLMILLNALFLFVTFSQTHYFSPTLLGENMTYWTLVVSGMIIFVMRKKYNISVFTPLPENDLEQTTLDYSQQSAKPFKFPSFKSTKVSRVAVVTMNKFPSVENPIIEASVEASVEGGSIEMSKTLKRSGSHVSHVSNNKKTLEKIDEENESESPTTMNIFTKKELQEDRPATDFVFKPVQINPEWSSQNEKRNRGI